MPSIFEARLFKAPVSRAREAQSFISNFCGHFFLVLNNFWAVQIISLRRCILGRKTGLLFRHIHSQLPECTALYGWCILSITMTLQLQGHLRMLLQMTPRDGNPRSQSQCQTQLTLQSITYDSLGTPLCDKPHAQSNPREL
jgi:hypothetical protein